MTHVPAMRVGWENYDPGPAPRSRLLDDPPPPASGGDVAALHAAWRARVEQDERSLEAVHRQQPVWYPIEKPGRHKVVPVLGGTPAAWDAMIANLVTAGRDAGFRRIQVASLTQWPVLSAVEWVAARARTMGVRFETVSASGSTVDLFGDRSPQDLVSFVVDALRVVADPQGRRDAGREKSELLAVGKLLDEPLTLERLTEAVDLALGSMASPPAGVLTAGEERKLRDYHHTVVNKRPDTANRLVGLLADLRELQRYRANPARSARQFGPSQVGVRVYDVDDSQGIQEMELGREILSRALARGFARSTGTLDLLIVAGAEHLAPEVLASLKGSAEKLDKQLVLFFGEISPLAQRTLGAGGSNFAVFLRLPNADDAEIAAKHFGRDFTFVVSGVSIAEGKTTEWSETHGSSSSSGTTRTSSFGMSFGSSIARSLSNETNQAKNVGGGTNQVTTLNTQRVHEYVIEPEQFQKLGELEMLVVEGKRAVLANCDYRLRNDRSAAPGPLELT